MTNAERQARFRAKQAATGAVPFTAMVPVAAIADLRAMVDCLLAAHRNGTALTIGPLRDPATGRMVRWN